MSAVRDAADCRCLRRVLVDSVGAARASAEGGRAKRSRYLASAQAQLTCTPFSRCAGPAELASSIARSQSVEPVRGNHLNEPRKPGGDALEGWPVTLFRPYLVDFASPAIVRLMGGWECSGKHARGSAPGVKLFSGPSTSYARSTIEYPSGTRQIDQKVPFPVQIFAVDRSKTTDLGE